jgi:hypothetical protein
MYVSITNSQAAPRQYAPALLPGGRRQART